MLPGPHGTRRFGFSKPQFRRFNPIRPEQQSNDPAWAAACSSDPAGSSSTGSRPGRARHHWGCSATPSRRRTHGRRRRRFRRTSPGGGRPAGFRSPGREPSLRRESQGFPRSAQRPDAGGPPKGGILLRARSSFRRVMEPRAGGHRGGHPEGARSEGYPSSMASVGIPWARALRTLEGTAPCLMAPMAMASLIRRWVRPSREPSLLPSRMASQASPS